jgi:uncharacterized protein YceH (UPF0502 family)
MELTFEERRVIGTLVEKAHTTPEQCPLTLNSLMNGCNQKSCREPMAFLTEEVVLDTLESLRKKGLAVLVRSSASRVDRWKQSFAATLDLSSKETAVLTELLLRGAQTDGELRQRASRMVRLESGEVGEVLGSLQSREQPLVARATAPGRKRGVKYDHLLYPEGEKPPPPVEEDQAPDAEPAALEVRAPSPAAPSAVASSELSELRDEVAELRDQLARLAERVGFLEASRGE